MNTLKSKEKPVVKKKKQGKVARSLMDILNGEFLTRDIVVKHLPFLFFVAFLVIFYIGYGYYAEKSVKQLYALEMELKELKSEFVSIKSRLVNSSTQSQVAVVVSAYGLQESIEPPKKIEVDENYFEQPKTE